MFSREIWERTSSLTFIESYPALPCPYCDGNSLCIDQQSLATRKLSGQALNKYMEKFGYSDVSNVHSDSNPWLVLLAQLVIVADSVLYEATQFVCFFQCSLCGESVSAMGIAKTAKNQSSDSMQIKVENFNPPIPMFPLNTTTPKCINEELLSSFGYFHSDVSSSGIKLRRAVEKLCKELGYSESKLHRNIERMAVDYPQEAKWLESLKLVGNEATHSDGVTEGDLLSSFEVFEVVLDIFRRLEVEPKLQKNIEHLDKKFKKS